MRFQRVAEAFDADVARVKLCHESSGSEHSPETSTDLFDLVKSFMEDENKRVGEEEEVVDIVHHDNDDDKQEIEKLECSDSENRAMLQGLFAGSEVDEGERKAKEKVREEVELACGLVGDSTMPEFKRRLMSKLREKGFDAGLCKSKWKRSGRLTAGDYEYIDVNFSGGRYIVEVSLNAEFEIARPTSQYSSLLDVFPLIFVGKVEELKRVVRLMCTAIKRSMKRKGLPVPPWRKNGHMQAKWFSSYMRTTNSVASREASSSVLPPHVSIYPKRSIGFHVQAVNAYNCSIDL